MAGKLSARKLAALKAGTKTADGGGLYAISSAEGRVAWGFLFTINRRRRLMSLGQWPDVSLAVARELAMDARRRVRSGIDPIEDRKVAKKRTPTFGGSRGRTDPIEGARLEVAKVQRPMAAASERLCQASPLAANRPSRHRRRAEQS